MIKIHWLGAGLSSIPGIKRLASNNEYLTVWNRTLPKAQKCIDQYKSDNITAKKFDVRKKLPFSDSAFEGCFSHMLYCMAFSTEELEFLSNELLRILKPGGINIYTVRHTQDGDYKNGVHIGEDLYENDGFIVHFFSKEKIKDLSKGFNIIEIEKFEEGSFPRKLFKVILKKKSLAR